jgi:hypothetical protein
MQHFFTPQSATKRRARSPDSGDRAEPAPAKRVRFEAIEPTESIETEPAIPSDQSSEFHSILPVVNPFGLATIAEAIEEQFPQTSSPFISSPSVTGGNDDDVFMTLPGETPFPPQTPRSNSFTDKRDAASPAPRPRIGLFKTNRQAATATQPVQLPGPQLASAAPASGSQAGACKNTRQRAFEWQHAAMQMGVVAPKPAGECPNSRFPSVASSLLSRLWLTISSDRDLKREWILSPSQSAISSC